MSSRSDEKHPYQKGFKFWSQNQFWNEPGSKHSDKSRRYFDRWLSDMRASEKAITRL